MTYGRDKAVTSREISAQLPSKLVAGSASTASGWDTLLQGTIFQTSLSGADIQVGVGANARADAKVILEGIKTRVTQSHVRESNYVVWQRQTGRGSTVETLTLPSFSGPGAPTFKGPVLAQVPAGDFKTEVQALARQPGMAYLGDLAKRSDVDWQSVKLAYDQWSYKQEGLTPAGAALLAVAVAVVTNGAGSDLVGASGRLGSAMADAAFSSLAAQASITLVNNKGNLGKTLQALANSDTVRATIAAMLTAGVLEKIGGLDSIQPLKGSQAFSDKLTFNLVNASGRALTNAAINGGGLEEALKDALLGAVVDTAHGEVAGQIKQLEAEYIAHKLAHALAGCAAGEAAQGSCRDGAIGSAVGEMVADTFKDQVPDYMAPEEEWQAFDAKVAAYGKLIAGATAAYAGGDAQTAITTAEAAIANNGRIALRQHAMRQQVSPQQYYMNLRAQSLQQAIMENGGSPTPILQAPGARVNYNQQNINQYEAHLRTLNPHHPLIYSQPSATLSPLPSSHVNMKYAIDMQSIGTRSGVNAFGFRRDSVAFFRELLRTNPELFSSRNVDRINDGKAPIVDAQWVQRNPTHQSFQGAKIVHHHWMQGAIAVPIPEPLHIQWNNVLHPYR